MDEIINFNRSIVPACDVNFTTYTNMLVELGDLSELGALKIGPELGLKYTLHKVVEETKKYSNAPLIYDHQAGGCDIPKIGKRISRIVRDAGFDAIIFKPKKNNLESLKEHIGDAQKTGLKVMVVGRMTHEKTFISKEDFRQSMEIYETSFEKGVYNFGVPSNDPQFLRTLNKTYSGKNVSWFPIGIGSQGGKVEEMVKIFGDSPIHPIVGEEIYGDQDVRQAAMDLIIKL